VPDKPKIGGSTWSFAFTGGGREVRTYDDRPPTSLADPLAAFDPPDAPNLPYVETAHEEATERPPTPPMTLLEEIEAAIVFEVPTPTREVDPVLDDGAGEPATDDDWSASEARVVAAGPAWRVRVRNGVEYAFGDETALRRFALKGTVLANDLVSNDGGLTWVVAWQLGIGADDFGDLFDFATTQPTILRGPREALVNWPRVGVIAVVLSLGTVLVLRLAHVNAAGSTGVFESPLNSWYDAALGSVVEAPRPRIALPPRPQPVAPPPPPAIERKELAVRVSTAADHAAVGKDALSRGAWEDAANAYRKALQLDPRNGQYKIGLAVAAEHLLESAQAAQAAVDAAGSEAQR
jgi:hypothetical protein